MGAGISNEGTLTIKNSTVHHNNATRVRSTRPP
jgi:hypothetical protein